MQSLDTSWRHNLTNSKRWKSAFYDLAIWFMFGLCVTQGLATYSPGYPIVVGSPSIPTGIYWLQKTEHAWLKHNDIVSFPFLPKQAWLQERYTSNQFEHTKYLTGLPGDTIKNSADNVMSVCSGATAQCKEVGVPLARDSAGRPLTAWLAPNESYQLKQNEAWVSGHHPQSLDSRYHGPIALNSIRGVASPIALFGIGIDAK